MTSRILLKSMATYGALSVLTKVLNFLVFPFIIARLSVAEWGELDLVFNFSGLITVLLTLSLESYIQRIWYEEGNRVVLMFSSWTLIGILSLSLFLIALLVVSFGFLSVVYALIFISGLAVALTVIPLQVLRMEERLFTYSGIVLLQILTFVLGVILLDYFSGLSVLNVMVCYFGSFVLIFLLLALFFLKSYEFGLDWFSLKPALKYSLPLLPTVVSGWILKQTDRLLILKFLDIESMGIYGAAVKVSSLVLILIQSFKLAWGPTAMKSLTLNNKENSNRLVLTTSIVYISVSCIVIGFLYSNINWIYKILEFPAAYYIGAKLVWILSLVLAIRGYTSIINIKVLIAKKTIINLILYMLGFTLTISISWILIPRLGLSGSVYGSVVGESFVLLGFLVYNYYVNKLSTDNRVVG